MASSAPDHLRTPGLISNRPCYKGIKHYYLRELPERYHGMIDIQAFGPGERLVFEPYTKEMYEDTHRWMSSWRLFPASDQPEASYETAVVA